MDLLERLTQIREKLSRVDCLPLLGETALETFERNQGVRLPEEYRGFLLHVGNTTVGPDHDLHPLDVADTGNLTYPYYSLRKPFLHTDFYDPETDETRKGLLQEITLSKEFERMEAYYDFCYSQTDGCLFLCFMACSDYRIYLVVTGEERGHIWCDGTEINEGIFPVARPTGGYPIPQRAYNGERGGLLDWYEFWLDEKLRRLRL